MTAINNDAPFMDMSAGHDTEAARMAAKLDNLSPRIILSNARRISTGYTRKPNWILAMFLFGLGSTYARALCVREGIDPDSNGIETL